MTDLPVVAPVRLDWDRFKDGWEWNRGEHATIIGPTGGGKTWLMTALLDKHPDVVVADLKPNDKTLHTRLPEGRWQYVSHWPPPQIRDDGPNWVVLKPKRRNMEDTVAHQTRIIRYLFRRIYHGPPGATEAEAGRWTIALPDLSIILDDLKGKDKLQEPSEQLALLYKHGRGIGVSIVIDAQTTAWLERLALDQPSHFFFFKPRDRDRAKRMAEIGNADPKTMQAAIDSLDAKAHEVLYVNSVTGDMTITVPK